MVMRDVRLYLTDRWFLTAMGVLLALFLIDQGQIGNVTAIIGDREIQLQRTPLACSQYLFSLDLYFALPLLCGLPIAARACAEWNSGFYRLQAVRHSWTGLGLRRIAATLLAGGLLLTIPALCAMLTFFLGNPYGQPYFQLASHLILMRPEDCRAVAELGNPALVELLYQLLAAIESAAEPLTDEAVWAVVSQVPKSLFVGEELKFMGLTLLGCFGQGALFALLSLTISAWQSNRFAAAGLPVLFVFIWRLLSERVAPLAPFSPYLMAYYALWGAPSAGLRTTCLVSACLLLLMAAAYLAGAGRRMTHA